MSVGLVIVSHSAQLAKGVVELAQQMTQGKVSLADAGGGEGDILGTSVEKIMAALQQVESPDGTLILLDLGSALLSTEMALEMLDEEQRPHVQITYAPLVEGTVAAALEASLGHSLAQVKQAAEKAAQPGQLRQLKPVEEQAEAAEETTSPPITPTTVEAPEHEIQITLNNPAGLHARPASLFVQTAARFQSSVQAVKDEKRADAKSIMEVLSLGARQHDTITLQASGPEAEAALQAMRELATQNFYETAETQSGPEQSVSVQPEPVQPQLSHKVWRGISTSKGVALGPAFVYTSGIRDLKTFPVQSIAPEQVAEQQSALQEALSQASKQLSALAKDVQRDIGQKEAGIFEAQAMMLQDTTLLNDARGQRAGSVRRTPGCHARTDWR